MDGAGAGIGGGIQGKNRCVYLFRHVQEGTCSSRKKEREKEGKERGQG